MFPTCAGVIGTGREWSMLKAAQGIVMADLPSVVTCKTVSRDLNSHSEKEGNFELPKNMRDTLQFRATSATARNVPKAPLQTL